MLLTGTSTVLGALRVHQSVAVYNSSVAFLKSIGKTAFPPMPNLNPIGISKDFVNYTSMIGALLALMIGWDSFRKEKQNNLLQLTLSRPVYRDEVITGKLIGSGSVLLIITAAAAILVGTLILSLSAAPVPGADIAKISLFFLAVWLYMMVFASLAQFLTLSIRDPSTALLIAVIIWLIFAFIFPQIGDTMDLDNQIPGGFFAHLGLDKGQEKQLLAHFSWYEFVRDGIEELSPTKHFERLSFALLGVKPGFSDSSPLQVMGMKWVNMAVLAILPALLSILSVLSFLRRELK
jgi:ABC-2 type transport system permease protein